MMKDMPEYAELAERTVAAEDMYVLRNVIHERVFQHGTAAFGTKVGYLVRAFTDSTLLQNEGYGLWYQGESIISENPYTGWLSRKKWVFTEELNRHMARFVQVLCVQCTVYSVQCTLYSTFSVLYSIFSYIHIISSLVSRVSPADVSISTNGSGPKMSTLKTQISVK